MIAVARSEAPFGIVALVGLWVTRPFWQPGGYVVGFDTYAYSGPNLQVTSNAVRDLRLPVLNDLIFAGTVHLGNPQAAVLYPPHLLAAVIDVNRAMGLLVTLHVIALGLGTVLLTTRLGFGRLGATTAGLVAVAAGATLTKSVQFEQILVIAWIPWLLAAIEATFTARRPLLATSGVAVTVAGVLLAGHPQFVYETIVLAAAVTVGFALASRAWRRLGWLAPGLALGALIALPQLVAAALATVDSAISGGRDYTSLLSPALSVQFHALPGALLGTVLDRDPAAFAGGFESIGYVGIAAAIASLLGVVAALRDPSRRPWAVAFGVVGVLAVLWSLGPRTFVFRVAFEVLPGFDLARGSARWIMIVVFVVAVFAGAGVDALARRPRCDQVVVAASGVAVAAVVIAVGPFSTERPAATVWIVTALLVVAIVALGVLVLRAPDARLAAIAVTAVLVAELLLMSAHAIPGSLRTATPFTALGTATTEWLADQDAGSTIALTDDGRGPDYQVPGLRPNSNALHGIPSVDGYDGGVQVTERWAEALRRFTPQPAVDLPLRNALSIPVDPEALARLGVRWILLDHARPPELFVPDWIGPVVSDEWFSVWENPAWIGDAVAWPASITVDGAPADALRDDPLATAGAAIVDDPDAVLTCVGRAVGCWPVGFPVERRTPEHLVIDVDLDLASIVSVDRQALDGWSVTVDGEPADELVVDGLFLGVEVPAGEHTVEWRYRSPRFGVTLTVSVLALAAAIALAVAGTVARRADSSRDDLDQPIERLEA